MPKIPPSSRRFAPDTRRRDLLIALAAGATMLLFVLYAVVYFSHQANASGMSEGIILRKTFVPQPETQLTFGQGGLNRRQVAGEYSLRVRVPQENDRQYTVMVDPGLYSTRKEGDHILFKKAATAAP